MRRAIVHRANKTQTPMLSAHNFLENYSRKERIFMTLPTHHPYFFTCPSCGCKLISVSSGVRAKPHCPECDYSADDAFIVKDRVMNEAMKVIADNAELAENFAETVKNEIASDDDAYTHIGFRLANDIRNQSPASEVLLTLCGWNIDTLLDKTPPIAIPERY